MCGGRRLDFRWSKRNASGRNATGILPSEVLNIRRGPATTPQISIQSPHPKQMVGWSVANVFMFPSRLSCFVSAGMLGQPGGD